MREIRRSRKIMRRMATWAACGMFVLSGCDPQVKDTILSGLNTASTGLSATFIDALFQKLQADDGATGA